jgi:hypothetical protein
VSGWQDAPTVDAQATAPAAPTWQSAPVANPETSQPLGFYKGLTTPLDNAARGLDTILGHNYGPQAEGRKVKDYVPLPGDVIDWIANKAGFASPDEAALAHKQYITDQAAKGVQPGAIGEIAGNIVGSVPTMAMGPFAGGAATGALLTDKDTPEGVLGDAAIGAGASYLGDKVLSGIGRAISPAIKPAVQKLLGEGVDLTPGQILGGPAQWAEDKVSSWPIVGDAIRNAKGRSITTFNKAAIQRVLTPVGETLPDNITPGRDAVTYAGDVLDQKYKSLLPKLTVQPDSTFNNNITNLRNLAQNLPGGRGQQFENLYQNEVASNLTGIGRMSGQTMKDVESKLGQEARSYSNSPDPDQRQYGSAVQQLQAELRNLVERNNPQYRGQLRNINRGWAALTRIENAAGRVGANSEGQAGVFTPAQLQGAVRAGDNSTRKRGFARGTALLQDLSDAGRSVLPSTVSNSGTTDRGALLGLAAAAPDIMLHGASDPMVLGPAAGLLGASTLYSKPGTRALQTLLARRPAGAQGLAQAVEDLKFLPRSAAAPLAMQYTVGTDQ